MSPSSRGHPSAQQPYEVPSREANAIAPVNRAEKQRTADVRDVMAPSTRDLFRRAVVAGELDCRAEQ